MDVVAEEPGVEPREERGQSFLAYVAEVREGRSTAPPPPRGGKPLPRAEAGAPPVADGECSAYTREGEPCDRADGLRDYDGVVYCPSHRHLASRRATLKEIEDFDREIEQRIARDTRQRPPSLHLVLVRVKAMVEASENNDKAALRDALLSIAAAATAKAREMR